eukprot:SAG31_NODE_24771_length_474_cov_0.994667_2_plen_36_part_01
MLSENFLLMKDPGVDQNFKNSDPDPTKSSLLVSLAR